MASVKLTERVVTKLEAPTPNGKQTLVWDADLKGFGVLLSGKTNTKSYIVQRALPDGRTRRITIERTNVMSLDDARKKPGWRWLSLHWAKIGRPSDTTRSHCETP